MIALPHKVGAEAIAAKGWLAAHQWLILRRASQLGILLAFLVGPWFGLWIVKGNLNYSYTLGVLPLTDPYLLLQMLVSGQRLPEVRRDRRRHRDRLLSDRGRTRLLLVACPVNLVTDAANWLRSRIGIKGGAHLSRTTRFWILAMTLVVAAATGTIAWEMVNPVSMLHRGLLFGMGAAWAVIIAIFLFDLFVMRHGWCGHLCPVGAFYSLIGKPSLMRITLPARDACNDCMDCFAVCPEQQVIRPALKAINGTAPIILDAACTNCGRCIDVCSKDVFRFGNRLTAPTPNHPDPALPGAAAAAPK